MRDDDEPVAVTLYGVRWYSITGALGFEDLPAVRVPLAAVSAWWISGGRAVSPPKDSDGAAWFAGVAIPFEF